MYSTKAENDKMEKYRSMIEDYNKENNVENNFITLSDTQELAFDMFKESKNLLIIGAAGTGKSKLINEMKYYITQQTMQKIVVTATTGVAAYNINGLTINAFLGIGTGDQDIDTIIRKVQRKPPLRDRIRNVDILVIDEISMMSAELFEKINALCQTIRRSAAPFGGIQMVLTGDFLQMSPVFNKNVELMGEQDTRLLFESSIFNKYFNKNNIINLKQNFRQTDAKFLKILQNVRTGNQTKEDIDILKSRIVSLKDLTKLNDIVHLVASNRQAQEINSKNLGMTSGPEIKYTTTYNEEGDCQITKELKKELQNQFKQKGICEIALKKNARVMLLKNLSVETGLVNGSIGTVVEFEHTFPIVQFDNGIKKLITPVEWELELGGCCCKATQLPLMLCWAITIHKIQSITLDKAVMSLDNCFCVHQVYVALSRVRTLEGCYLKSFNPSKITVCEKTKKFLKTLE